MKDFKNEKETIRHVDNDRGACAGRGRIRMGRIRADIVALITLLILTLSGINSSVSCLSFNSIK